ncbi:MAG: glycosyltransferase, partial [Alcaligenaceae bacterium]
MISVVVPAHNEEALIGRTLSQWVAAATAREIDVVVVCNGCTDDTARIARSFGPAVKVVETDVASKTNALNLGDRASVGFPRIYIDADITISVDAIRALADRLARRDVLAVAPTPEIDLTGCSWLVRKYYDIRSRLPSAHEGIGGSGVYALSEAGRGRFQQFPSITADDTYVRLQFRPEERETLRYTKSKIFPPRTLAQLIRVRTRIHRGTFELARLFPELSVNKGETNDRTLLALFRDPRLWSGLFVYCWVNMVARRKAIGDARCPSHPWQRDETSRAA